MGENISPTARPPAGAPVTGGPDRVALAAQDFEAAYLGPVLDKMMADAMPDPRGGKGEEMFRTLMANELAGSIAQAGGVGIAGSVEAKMREYLK